MLNLKMSKGLSFIILVLFMISNFIKSDNHDYLKQVIERLNSVEEELKSLQSSDSVNAIEDNSDSKYINSIANHEQRLVDIEEEIRGLNGFLEEINYKIDNLIKMKKSANELDPTQPISNEQVNNLNDNTVLFEEKQSIISKDPNIEKNPTMKVLGTISDNEEEATLEKNQNKIKEEIETNSSKTIKQQNNQSDSQLQILSKSPSEIYKYAYDMLIRENYIEAESSFKIFIGEHPNDPLASNAYYWLGETYYVQKNFQLAAVSFAKGFQKFPKGNKALDQLFKLALTFLNLGKNEDACATFSKLEAEFPDAPKRITNRAKVYTQRAKC